MKHKELKCNCGKHSGVYCYCSNHLYHADCQTTECKHPKRCPRCDACTNCFPNCCEPKDSISKEATEKPMDWEERLNGLIPNAVFKVENENRKDKGIVTVDRSSVKHFIKDLLKDSNAYQAGISAERVNNPHTYDIYTQSDMDFKIAEYKQKLIKRLQGMKDSAVIGEEQLYLDGWNYCLDEVEAVIKWSEG